MAIFLLILLIVSLIGNFIQHYKINYYKQLNSNWYLLYTELYDKFMHLQTKTDADLKEEKKKEEFQE